MHAPQPSALAELDNVAGLLEAFGGIQSLAELTTTAQSDMGPGQRHHAFMKELRPFLHVPPGKTMDQLFQEVCVCVCVCVHVCERDREKERE